MFKKIIDKRNLIAVVLIVIIILGLVLLWPNLISKQAEEISSTTREVTRLVPQTVIVTQIVEKVVTATPMPFTATPQNTPTASLPPATATPSQLSVLPDGLLAWCLPRDVVEIPGEVAHTGNVPEGALLGRQTEESLNLTTQVQNCTFVYTFNQNVPAGTLFQIYDMYSEPFISLELTPLTENPQKAYATTNHVFIIDPPYWEISYIVLVKSASGEEIRRDIIKLSRSWFPGFCQGSTLPDPVTLLCPETGMPPGQ